MPFKITARPVKPGWVQHGYLKPVHRAFADQEIASAAGAPASKTAPALPATGNLATLPVLETRRVAVMTAPAARRVA